jgi:hypothetical protein
MKNNFSLPSYFVGAIIALVSVVFTILVSSVIWPLIKWASKFAFKKMRKAFSKKPKKEEPKFISELPTPEIFKGASNLGPAKQMNLSSILK